MLVALFLLQSFFRQQQGHGGAGDKAGLEVQRREREIRRLAGIGQACRAALQERERVALERRTKHWTMGGLSEQRRHSGDGTWTEEEEEEEVGGGGGGNCDGGDCTESKKLSCGARIWDDLRKTYMVCIRGGGSGPAGDIVDLYGPELIILLANDRTDWAHTMESPYDCPEAQRIRRKRATSVGIRLKVPKDETMQLNGTAAVCVQHLLDDELDERCDSNAPPLADA